jgi:hypothetical protein
MSDVRSLELLGEQQAQSRWAATFFLGWWGLAAKGSAQFTYLTVHLSSGDDVYLVLRKRTHMEVRAELASLPKAVDVPFEDDLGRVPPATPQPRILQEIDRAWELLQKGAITQEEDQQLKHGHFPSAGPDCLVPPVVASMAVDDWRPPLALKSQSSWREVVGWGPAWTSSRLALRWPTQTRRPSVSRSSPDSMIAS